MSDSDMDRGAVTTLNVLAILMLVGLTLFWLSAAMAQVAPAIIDDGLNPYNWDAKYAVVAVLSVLDVLLALLHLAGVSLIVNRKPVAPISIQVFSALMLVCVVFQASVLPEAAFVSPVYIVLGFLIGIIRKNFKR